ncbi:MAG: M48 family metalloprotease [Gammaproteobacteria bacterium]|nr:M48 family metalloprotease [Gammaproteobacteria bacterium]
MRKIIYLTVTLFLAAGYANKGLTLDFSNIDLGKIIDTGKKAAQILITVPVEKEVEIGRGMSASLLGAAPLVDNDKTQRYVNRVGQWLASQTEREELTWHFGVLDVDTVNAFAAPGGYIFVTKGLMRLCGTESELAGVLAHEIGHVLQRHHLEALRKQAASELATDLASDVISEHGFNAKPFIKSGMELFARGLDRADELEADRIGVVIATRAGYEPYGLPRVLLTLNDMNPADSNLAWLTSTHPPSSERLSVLEQLMKGKFESFNKQPQVVERYAMVAKSLF